MRRRIKVIYQVLLHAPAPRLPLSGCCRLDHHYWRHSPFLCVSPEHGEPDWRDRGGTPTVYLQKTPDTFWLVPVPNSNKQLIMNVALKPSRTTRSIDTTFSDTYRDAILYGTVYRLLRIPQKEWTDPTASADYFGLFKLVSNKSYNQAELTKVGAKLIFPFVKSIVEDISNKGGSVSISLKDIDFELVKS